MATVYSNISGTTSTSFRIGTTGPSIITGTSLDDITSPLVGDIFINTSDGTMSRYSGSAWSTLAMTSDIPEVEEDDDDTDTIVDVVIPVGALGTPSLAFEDDTTTGLYQPVTSSVTISGNSTGIATFSQPTQSVMIHGKLILTEAGTIPDLTAPTDITDSWTGFMYDDGKIAAYVSGASVFHINDVTETDGVPDVSSFTFDTAGGFTLPVGTSDERPSSPVTGVLRYNTSRGRPEYYNGSKWKRNWCPWISVDSGTAGTLSYPTVGTTENTFNVIMGGTIDVSDATYSVVMGQTDTITGMQGLVFGSRNTLTSTATTTTDKAIIIGDDIMFETSGTNSQTIIIGYAIDAVTDQSLVNHIRLQNANGYIDMDDLGRLTIGDGAAPQIIIPTLSEDPDADNSSLGGLYYNATNDAIMVYTSDETWHTVAVTGTYTDDSYLQKSGGIMGGALYLATGSVSEPSLSFSASETSGMYIDSDDTTIIFSINAANTFAIAPTAIVSEVTHYMSDGTADDPSVTFDSDSSVGFYLSNSTVTFIGEGITLPSDTTDNRPSTASAGMTRFNSTTTHMEYYDGTDWYPIPKCFTDTATNPLPGDMIYDTETDTIAFYVDDGS